MLADLYKQWTGRGDAELQEDRYTTAVWRDGMMVGAAQLFIVDDKIWHWRWGSAENAYVSPEYRQQGVAKELMARLEEYARAKGCRFIKLTTGNQRIEAHVLYRSLGYREGKSFIKDLI